MDAFKFHFLAFSDITHTKKKLLGFIVRNEETYKPGGEIGQ